MFKRDAGTAGGHAGEQDLLAFADDDAPLAPAERRHIESCARCAARAKELRRMRRLLQETAGYVETPPRSVALGALARLRHRRAAIGHVNEWFGVLAALLRGFSTLLRSEPAGHDSATRDKDTIARG